MRWKAHVRFGRRPGETHLPKDSKGAPGRSHVATQALDEVRRRVQQETTGHRGRKGDPLYRIRRPLTMASERLDDTQLTRLKGHLAAGDPQGEARNAWHAR